MYPGVGEGQVACFLGFGTMIGWKRIVVTVGEKIGKEHLTYGQGASAELVAMGTIGLADWFGLPVSTTHVLVGSCGADGGKPFGIAGGDAQEYRFGLGADAAGLRAARRVDLLVRLVYPVQRLWRALRSLAAAIPKREARQVNEPPAGLLK